MTHAPEQRSPSFERAAYTVGSLASGTPCCEPTPHMSVRDLSVHFGPNRVLNKVTIDIPRGCITALIGPSGCGKTTFLSSLNRMTDLLEGCRVSGTVTMDGQDIYEPTVDVLHLRRRVGMVFQRPNPFPLSIYKNLDMPLREQGVRNASERADRIEAAFKQTGLWAEVADRLHKPAFTLSGGQQQRLCIARAIAMTPRILLMDEPCSALDPIASGVVEDLIATLRGRYTIVVVTHNLAQARRIANYAAFFWMAQRAGTLVEFGLCQRIFEAPASELTAQYVSGARG